MFFFYIFVQNVRQISHLQRTPHTSPSWARYVLSIVSISKKIDLSEQEYTGSCLEFSRAFSVQCITAFLWKLAVSLLWFPHTWERHECYNTPVFAILQVHSTKIHMICALCGFGIDWFYPYSMMTSSNGTVFRVTGPLCGEFPGQRWIPRTKASDAELWCFLWSALNKRVSKQSSGWWFETLSHPLWRHRNASALLHWHRGNHTIAPVPVKQPWRTWVNDSHKSTKSVMASPAIQLHCFNSLLRLYDKENI